jgi:hypothetical protein
MRRVMVDGGIERRDDLHIDQIDARFRDRRTWLSGALLAFDLAIRLRDEHAPAYTIVLALSLSSEAWPIGINFRTTEELEREFNWSPPSLYLFHEWEEPWNDPETIALPDQVLKELDFRSLFGDHVNADVCYFSEFRHPDIAEYSRSVFLVA